MVSILRSIRAAITLDGKRTLAEAWRFIVIGCVCYGSGLLTLVVLVTWLHVHYLVANVMALAVAFPVGYWLNRKLNFKSRRRIGAEIARYYLANTVTFGVALGAVAVMVELLHINYVVANLLASAAQTALNFSLAKWWIFAAAEPRSIK
jgi:putative flippase GtrA